MLLKAERKNGLVVLNSKIFGKREFEGEKKHTF